MPNSIRVGMVGYKFMGKAHSNAYLRVPIFFDPPLIPELKAICGRNRDQVEEAAQRYRWQSVETSWEKLVERDDIDLIDINTPTESHAAIAIAAAENGKHVLLEKPMAMNLSEARQILEAAERSGVKHMIGFNYRYFPAMQLAKRLIDEGKLGRIFHFRAVYLQDWLVDGEFPMVWRLDRKIAGSGALGDLCAHIIDMAQYLVGNIDSLTATAETFIRERPVAKESRGLSATAGAERRPVTVDDAVILLARFSNGALGTFEATRFALGHKNGGRFEINGSEGSVRFDLERMNELEVLFKGDGEEQGFRTVLATEPSHPYVSAWWPPGHVLGWEHSHIHQVYHLLESIGNNRMPEASFVQGVKNQAVLDTVGRSLSDGQWHSVVQISE